MAILRWGIIVLAAVFTILFSSCRAAIPQAPQNSDSSTLPQLTNSIRDLVAKAQYQPAVALAEQALRSYPDDPEVLKAASKAYAFLGAQNTDDPAPFQTSRELLQRLIDQGVQDSEVFGRMGYIQQSLGKLNQAIDAYQSALELAPNDALVLTNLGSLYTNSGRYEKAVPILQKASEIAPSSSGSPIAAHLPWLLLSDAQRLVGDYAESLQSAQKALDLTTDSARKEVAEELEFTRTLAAGHPSWKAFWNHYTLAKRHQESKRTDRDAAEFEKMIDAVPEDGTPDVAMQRGWAQLCLATDRLELRQFDAGRDAATKAIELLTQAKKLDLLAKSYRCLARAYDNLMTRELAGLKSQDPIATKTEYRKKQMDAYDQAERCYREAGNSDDANDSHIDMAYQRAWVFGVDDPVVKEVREELRKNRPADGAVLDEKSISAISWEADFLELAKDNQGAFALYQRLEKYYDSLSPDETWDRIGSDYLEMARFASLLYNDNELNIKYREKALAVAEGIRNRSGNDRYRRNSVSSYFQAACSSLVTLLAQKGDTERAFHYAELYKGRALLDLLNSDAISTISRSEKRRERHQRATELRIAKLQNEVSRNDNPTSADRTNTAVRDLSIEQTGYQRLAEDVGISKLELSNISRAEVADWSEVKPLLKGITLVDYVIMPGQYNCALVVSEDGIKGVPLALPNGRALSPLVDAFRKGIGAKSPLTRDLNVEKAGSHKTDAEAVSNTDANDAGKKLWELLVAPVLPYLKTGHIVISSYDVLNYIPFEALQDSNGRYLIQDHSISYTPSVSVLKLCMAKERHGKSNVLALGNPNLRNPAFRLFNAENEVKSLEGMFPKVDVLTFDAATETAFKQKAAQYDILHVACHGELNLDDPMLTSLRLAPDAANDGYLHTGEIFQMNLSASLVVLSACNTAIGELTRGNELMGLTRGFFFAGAPSIVASLWTVDDRSTALLMEAFYKNLATMNKAEALRQAKLTIMKDFPSPFHWAPFCLQGDFR